VDLRTRVTLCAALAAGACVPRAGAPVDPAPAVATLTAQVSHTTALLQAVSAVNDSVVWVAGHHATWVRTVDGGRTWEAGAMTGPDSSLEFRDVYAADADTAYLLAAGPGERSRIYQTTDAGRSWRLQFVNHDSTAFFDCFDFWDARHGVAVSDAVARRLIVLRTEDGGAHWQRVPDEGIPPALPGEGAFAASGTCLVARGAREAWIGAGGDSTGERIYHSVDGGRHWTAAALPLITGRATGVATLAFSDAGHGLAAGGRLANAADRSDSVVAVTDDRGASWRVVARPAFPGAVFGLAVVPGLPGYAVAAGPGGLASTPDDGAHWTTLGADAYWAVGFASRRAGWAVGPAARIVRVTFAGGENQ